MAHNCPADWVYLAFFGCFQSMADFWATVYWSLAITLTVTLALLVYRRWRFSPKRAYNEGSK